MKYMGARTRPLFLFHKKGTVPVPGTSVQLKT